MFEFVNSFKLTFSAYVILVMSTKVTVTTSNYDIINFSIKF